MTEREAGEADIVDLIGLAQANPVFSPVWTHQSGDLNVNLIVFERGDGIAEVLDVGVGVDVVEGSGGGALLGLHRAVDESRGSGHPPVVGGGTGRGVSA